MMTTDPIQHRFWGICLVLAPLVSGASTFFWQRVNGRIEYGAIGGALLVIATVFWIPSFAALFALLRPRMPRVGTWGPLVAWYGCLGGAAFGFDGLYAEAFGLAHQARLVAWSQYKTAFDVTLLWPGPVFPLSLLLLGVLYVRTRITPMWVGALLVLAGLAFPASRIPRIAAIAHAADLLMFVPLAWLGWRYLSAPSDSRST